MTIATVRQMVSRGMCGLTMVLVGYKSYNNKMRKDFFFFRGAESLKVCRWRPLVMGVFEFSGGNSQKRERTVTLMETVHSKKIWCQ